MRQPIRNGLRNLSRDPRHYQIACLTVLLAYGVTVLHFDVRLHVAAAMAVTALATQWACTQLFALPRFDPRSPLISLLSLMLLLRTDLALIGGAAAFTAIASKFLIRWRGKHLFNPTNIGIVALILLSDRAWVSSGQWGSGVWIAFFLACLGSLVVTRCHRADMSLAVMAFYALLLFGRAVYLGDPFAIPMHQLQNGALLIFAFFMISDPKTTPDARAGRIIHAALVVAFAGWVQFGLFEPHGLLYGLAAMAPAVPLLDALLPGRRFQWSPQPAPTGAPKGVPHDPNHPSPRPVPVSPAAG